MALPYSSRSSTEMSVTTSNSPGHLVEVYQVLELGQRRDHAVPLRLLHEMSAKTTHLGQTGLSALSLETYYFVWTLSV